MNVKQLKKLLENVPDRVIVVTPAPDHEFRQIHVSCIKQTTGLFKGSIINEDYGDDTPEAEFGKRRAVLLIY